MDEIIKKRMRIESITACGVLIFGLLLSTIGFFTPPLGQVHYSVLYILAQCFIYAGSIFGISSFYKGKTKELEIKYDNMFKEKQTNQSC